MIGGRASARGSLTRTAFYLADEGEERKGRKPGMSAKTAKNVFGEVTSGFAEAVHSKLEDLRVLDRNPAEGVRGPMTTDEREQAALYPSDVVALLSCERVPVSRRRVYFVALYTGMRRGELELLDAAAVDLDHDLITVRGKKTSAARRQIPIEKALRPLLVSLVRTRPSGPLLDVPRADGKGASSDLIKRDCELASLDRADLWRDDATTPITCRSPSTVFVIHASPIGRLRVGRKRGCSLLPDTRTRK